MDMEKVYTKMADIAKEAEALIEENKELKAKLLTQEQQPKGLDRYVAKRLNDVVKVPCGQYTNEVDDLSSLEKIEMVDGTIITIEREIN
ncbi:hypothetical protein [Staphylococcus shinii]|uniref:hypothetical protein n=1 Tax=Staphylococcus shinii TaxID=2912228 RepID=UPI003D803793